MHLLKSFQPIKFLLQILSQLMSHVLNDTVCNHCTYFYEVIMYWGVEWTSLISRLVLLSFSRYGHNLQIANSSHSFNFKIGKRVCFPVCFYPGTSVKTYIFPFRVKAIVTLSASPLVLSGVDYCLICDTK